MSVAYVLMMVLLGTSVVVAFVLQPSNKESDVSANTARFHQSCHGLSLQSLKNDLLKSLNLQAEPQVPMGLLDSVREQWKQAFSALSNQAHGSEEVHSASSSFDNGNSNSLKCCSMASEIFLKDLGWSNWVIYPLSLTITHCKVCSVAGNTVHCPHASPQNDQVLSCQPTSQKTVPIVYMDEYGTVSISSVQLTTGCGFATNTHLQPINK